MLCLLKGILFPTRRVLEQFPTVNLLIFPLKGCDRGPLPDINRVITPINGQKMGKWDYNHTKKGAIIPFITIWGPPCVGCGNLGQACRVNTGHWRLAICRPHRAAGCPAHHVSLHLAKSFRLLQSCVAKRWVFETPSSLGS